MGLNLNLKKTTVVSAVDKVNIFSDAENISTVTNCMYFITNEETKKRIRLSKAAVANLTTIIKNMEV
jgi:hypothetical protein